MLIALLLWSDLAHAAPAVPFADVVRTMWDDTMPLTSNEYDEWSDPRHPAAYAYMLSCSLCDGHGGQSGRFCRYRDFALEYAFALDQLGIRE